MDPRRSGGGDAPVDIDDLNFLTAVDFAATMIARRKPGASPLAARLVLDLTRIADVVVYDIESTVHRPRGWSWSAFRVLFTLWLTGPLETRKITQLTGMSRAAVSALIGTLERDGFVARSSSALDHRTRDIALTENGFETVDSVLDEHNEREQLWASALSVDEQTELARLLEKLADSSADLGIKTRG